MFTYGWQITRRPASSGASGGSSADCKLGLNLGVVYMSTCLLVILLHVCLYVCPARHLLIAHAPSCRSFIIAQIIVCE